jgi:heptaprenyl diphosphate synthase
MQNRKIAYYGLFSALALLMGYVEMMIPMPIAVPGIKLGLANVVVVLTLYFMDAKSAAFISLLRVLLSGLLFSGFSGFLYSMAGAIVSLIVMILLQKIKKFSIVGVSIAGGVSHNVGQILVACAVVQNAKLLYYFPWLLVAGVVTGFLIGIIVQYCLGYLRRKF